ncbi:zinc finger protein 830 [Caerostris darwini]|uniref:Zinc finger protein 830 n=1 Tax=Caerostris darwini TaxID=1538125 RepID=A0AAV4NWH4_9ARAC|nr:zinc finger protein 830 [Caerostris darwini]
MKIFEFVVESVNIYLKTLIQVKKIVSKIKLWPLNLGQLSCSICNVNIKSNNLWGTHIAGKNHRESLSKQKKTSSSNDVKNSISVGIKRKAEPVEADVLKKVKNEMKPPEQLQSSKATSLLESYCTSSDDSDVDVSENTVPSQSSSNTALPSDFFDNSASNLSTPLPVPKPESEKEVKIEAVSNNVETLPEGFFDDPVLDATARNIEYKDPVEEEWEKFQKTIVEETNVSKTIIADDAEESYRRRDIEEVYEQIQLWQRVNKLELLVDDAKLKATKKDTPKTDEDNDASDSTDDDLDLNDLLDWRSKGIKKC